MTGHGDHLTQHGRIVGKLFIDRNEQGQTFVDRWETEGFTGLKNDQVNLLQHKRRMRFGVTEHLTSTADGHLKILDLLRPDEGLHTHIDLSMSATACRFDVFVTWYYPLPHFRRYCGNGIKLPDFDELEPIESFRTIVQHLGGPEESTEIADWCAVHFERVFAAITATSLARQERRFSLTDARFGKAIYELRKPFAVCRAQFDDIENTHLDDLSETEDDEGFADARVWIDDKENAASETIGGEPVLGRVLMGQANWRIETMGEARFRKLRRQFESQMGDQVKFVKERLDNLAAQLSEKDDRQYDPDLVPPVLLEDVRGLIIGNTRIPRSDNAKDGAPQLIGAPTRPSLDKPIPLFDGKTPREAASDLILRPTVLRWAKRIINQHDQKSLETGQPPDIDWLPLELDLPEIAQPRPPLLKPAATVVDDYDDHENHGEEVTPPRPAPPRLPKKPLDFRQIEERADAAISLFESVHEGIDELYLSGTSIIDDLEDAVDGLIDAEEFTKTIPFILQTWFTLVPPGSAAPFVSPDEVRRSYLRAMEEISCEIDVKTPEKAEQVFKRKPQPHLRMALSSQALVAMRDTPGDMHFPAVTQLVTLAIIFTIIDVLDPKLR